jgi:hypothetical protein
VSDDSDCRTSDTTRTEGALAPYFPFLPLNHLRIFVISDSAMLRLYASQARYANRFAEPCRVGNRLPALSWARCPDRRSMS